MKASKSDDRSVVWFARANKGVDAYSKDGKRVLHEIEARKEIFMAIALPETKMIPNAVRSSEERRGNWWDFGIQRGGYRRAYSSLITTLAVALSVTGCAIRSDIKQCRGSTIDQSFIHAEGQEKTQLLSELVGAIKVSGAMIPNSGPPYRHYVFVSGNKAALCELGPCLPTRWLFEQGAHGWTSTNQPEGICVSSAK